MKEDRPKKSGAPEDLLSKFGEVLLVVFFAELQAMAPYFTEGEEFERFSDNFQKSIKFVDRKVFSC